MMKPFLVRFIDFQDEINNNPAFQGFDHCHKFFERKVQKLKDALAKNITKFINIQLRNNGISLDYLEQVRTLLIKEEDFNNNLIHQHKLYVSAGNCENLRKPAR